MLNQFLHTARIAVSDINNFLKTNAEICLDFMMRIDTQVGALDALKGDLNASYNRIATATERMDIPFNEMDPRFFLEENY